MPQRGASKVGAVCAIAGALLLLLGTYLHPMSADPNDALAAFTEYAADHLWVASHLTQLAGVALMIAALIFLSYELDNASARVAAGGAIASLAVAAALQAVDGVALKRMVDAWALAPAADKAMAFQAAFAVRQIEVGLAAMFSLLLGSSALLYGLALMTSSLYPRWLGIVAIVGGGVNAIAGVVIAYTGFSDTSMNVSMPASVVMLIWMIAIGILMWRHASVNVIGP